MSSLLLKLLLSASVFSFIGHGRPLVEPTVRSASPGKAIYFLTNNAENAVISASIEEDGTLQGGSVTWTGGKGHSAFDMMKNVTSGPDALLSQAALSIAGKVSPTRPMLYYYYYYYLLLAVLILIFHPLLYSTFLPSTPDLTASACSRLTNPTLQS